jgi:hypothetical protein
VVSRALLECVEEVHMISAGLPSIGDDPVVRRDARSSDHFPVLGRLSL